MEGSVQGENGPRMSKLVQSLEFCVKRSVGRVTVEEFLKGFSFLRTPEQKQLFATTYRILLEQITTYVQEECASVCAANHVTEKLNRLDQHLLEKSLVHDFLEDNTEQPNPILQAKQASVDLKKQELEFLKSTLAASLEEEQKLQQQLETRQTAILQAQEKLQERLSLVTACFEELAR